MKQFTDDSGEVWTLKATVDAFERIRDLAKIDFTLVLTDKGELEKFTDSNAKIVEVLWAWLQPSIEDRSLTPEAFGGRMYECLEEAFNAVLEELPNFSPPHRRKAAGELIKKYLSTVEQENDRIRQTLHSDRTQELINRALDKAEAEAFGVAERMIAGNESTNSEDC